MIIGNGIDLLSLNLDRVKRLKIIWKDTKECMEIRFIIKVERDNHEKK